jgi:hypothetical protein
MADKILESTLTYLNTKVDDFESKYFIAKKDDDKEFLRESLLFYRFEAAEIRRKILDLEPFEDDSYSGQGLRFEDERHAIGVVDSPDANDGVNT